MLDEGLQPTAIDHVGLAVRDLDASLARLAGQYGLGAVSRHHVEAQGVEEAMLPIGESYLQLVCPTGADTPVGRFLERRGEGMHHVAYRVEDIATSLSRLANAGVELIDTHPRQGVEPETWIAFLHPGSNDGVLVELVQRGGLPPRSADGAPRTRASD